jgi:hypothetical protein
VPKELFTNGLVFIYDLVFIHNSLDRRPITNHIDSLTAINKKKV